MIKYNAILLLGAASLVGGVCAQERPNIIHIMTDDHSFRALSAYGGVQYGETPHLDKMADEGVLFHKAYVTNSISAPSRAVLLTGKHSHINGKRNNVDVFDNTQQTFPKLLQKAGYTTAVIGKWHLTSTPTGFDYWEVLPGQGHYYNPDFIQMDGKKRRFEGYCTDIITDKSLKWIGEQKDTGKPFCLLMHHKAPHRNWVPNVKYLDLYSDRTYELPETFYDNFDTRGSAARKAEMKITEDLSEGYDLKIPELMHRTKLSWEAVEDSLTWSRMNDKERKILRKHYKKGNKVYLAGLEGKERDKWIYNRYLQDYTQTIASVDESVGRLMAYLEAEGLDKNTIVVYTSDQSFYMGEHGWYDKRFMYEESFRMPLIVWYPEHIKPNVDKEHLVQNLDYASTYLDYAGVAIPDDLQGVSMRPVLEERVDGDWRKSIYYHFYGYPETHHVRWHYGVKTDRYKLIHFYGEPKRKIDTVVDYWELYDTFTDPNELNNVYDDATYADVRYFMTQELSQLQEAYDVQ